LAQHGEKKFKELFNRKNDFDEVKEARYKKLLDYMGGY
jgi:hypothetical protein